jgi:hypothetical protein
LKIVRRPKKQSRIWKDIAVFIVQVVFEEELKYVDVATRGLARHVGRLPTRESGKHEMHRRTKKAR